MKSVCITSKGYEESDTFNPASCVPISLGKPKYGPFLASSDRSQVKPSPICGRLLAGAGTH
jgi:hypothetical protein